MENSKENKMGTMPLFKLILSMSVPAMFSMLIQALYNIVDSIFVAKIGQDALTAVSLAFPIQMILVAVGVGTGVGINSLVSRRLGEKKVEEASKVASHGILLAIASGIIFAVLGLLFSRIFMKSFTEDQGIIQMGSTYLNIVCLFSLGVFMQIAIEKTLQATGNMIFPMLIQLIGAVTNIILDPIFIFGYFGVPKMGVAGAAIATVIGQWVSMLFSIYLIVAKNHEVKVSLKKLKVDWLIIKNIYAVGLPAIVMQSISSVMISALNIILISFSQAAVAVFGIYFKLQSFVFMPVFGVTQGIMPILGYNFGAKNKKRLIGALKIGITLAAGIMTVGTVIFLVFPREMLLIFDATEEMLAIGTVAFRMICASFIMAAFGILFSTLFQAIGMGMKSLIISLLRQLIIIIPVSYLFSFIGLNYVWLAFPISELFAFILSIIFFTKIYHNVLNKL